MQEMQVQSLSREDTLEKEIATHSGILAWEIPWAEESGELQFMGLQGIGHDLMTSLVAQTVKRLPAMQETRVWSLGREDPLEKEMATHSSILAWEIPWAEESGGLESMKLQRDKTQLSNYTATTEC